MNQSNLGGNTGNGHRLGVGVPRIRRRRRRCRRRERGLRAVRERASGAADQRVASVRLRALDERQRAGGPPISCRRAGLVDRRELALRDQPCDRGDGRTARCREPGEPLPHARRSATACSSLQPATRSSPSRARPASRARHRLHRLAPPNSSYWLVASDGGIFTFGNAGFSWFDRRHPTEPADRRHGAHTIQRGLLARGVRRRHLHLRRRGLLRLQGGKPLNTPDRRHGRHARRRRLLASRLRRGHLQLRRRRLPRLHGGQTTEQADRRHGRDPRRPRLLAGRLRRGHLQLRRRRLPRLHGRQAAEQAHRRHGGHARRAGLLARGFRRRHLQLRRRRVLRFSRWLPSASRPWAWPPRPTVAATGSSRPTAASSITGAPTSVAPKAASF